MQNGQSNSYIAYWKNYFNFKGRSTIKEFWAPIFINMLIYFVLFILMRGAFSVNSRSIIGIIFGISLLLFIIANIVPSYAILFRRFRDAGRRWQTCLISIILVISCSILTDFVSQNTPLAFIFLIVILVLEIYLLWITLTPTKLHNKKKWI